MVQKSDSYPTPSSQTRSKSPILPLTSLQTEGQRGKTYSSATDGDGPRPEVPESLKSAYTELQEHMLRSLPHGASDYDDDGCLKAQPSTARGSSGDPPPTWWPEGEWVWAREWNVNSQLSLKQKSWTIPTVTSDSRERASSRRPQ